MQQWQHHPISSENNLSPIQLFTQCVLQNLNSDFSGIDSFVNGEDLKVYGVDYGSQMDVDVTDYQVAIPAINAFFNNYRISSIEQNVNLGTGNGIIAYLLCRINRGNA